MAYKYSPPVGYSPGTTRSEILQEFRRWNEQAGASIVSDWDLPLAKASDIEASVRFLLRNREVNVHVSKWDNFAVNLRCCYLIIRDMRLTEARGSLQALAEAVAGLLPAPARQRDPYEILGIRPDADPEDIDAMYRIKAKRLHPDTGGSAEAFKELQDAYERVRNGVSGAAR